MYEWIKALHVISVIAWMAALFYVPRLFVYHADAVVGSDKSETFKIMERRLMKAIAAPAMAATWVFGLILLFMGDWLTGAGYWIYAKLFLVVVLSGFDGICRRWLRAFAEDRNTRSARFFRLANEVPTVLMIFIVIFVVVKPF